MKRQISKHNFHFSILIIDMKNEKKKIFENPCIEIIIQKINFLKNENCIFSFFNFWNMNLNVIFRFFEMQILISIWVSIKIETKFEFMEFDCDVKELLSGW